MILSRKKLYKLVWSKPLTQLAKEFSYSDNGLRKICVKHNIPLPKSGYWSKIKFNKKVEIIPLPKGDKNLKIELKIRKDGDKDLPVGLSEFQILKRQIENDESINHLVPEKITKYDPLIVSARKDLKSKKPYEWGNSKGLLISSKEILDIEVSKSNISRALKFMDTLIKIFRKRNYEIKFDRGTYVVVNGESLKIRLREPLKRLDNKDNEWKRYDLIPSGMLTFRLEKYPERQWKDSEKNPLETKISSIVATIELRAKKEKKERIEREEWHRQYEIRKKKEEEFKELRKKEIEQFRELFNSAERYQKTLYIRNYIDRLESFENENNTITEEKKKWIQWAKDKADWFDPFIEKEDSILSGIDRNDII